MLPNKCKNNACCTTCIVTGMISKLTWYWACILSSWGDLGRQDYGASGSNSASYHSLIAIHDTRITRAYLTYKKKYIVTFSSNPFRDMIGNDGSIGVA